MSPEAQSLGQPLRWKRGYFRVVVFLLVAYAWPLWRAFNQEWARDDASYGPLVLVLGLMLLFVKWDDRKRPERTSLARLLLATSLVALAAALYVGGIVGDLAQFSLASLSLLLLAQCLLFQVPTRQVLLPAILLSFCIPLPGFLVDPITLPLKAVAAHGAVVVLQLLDYPVAQSGVMLQLGQYQLEVADACAGLRTLFSLEAIGLMYISVTPSGSMVRSAILAMLVFPIALAANVARVLVLCLITFHFGDAAGQGFLHGFTGLTLFAVALGLLMLADQLVRRLVRRPTPGHGMAAS